MNAHTNLPALIDALPSDSTRAAQTEFTRERQVAFLAALATSGAVRQAAKHAGVSHQSTYRARRACREFRTAWDAALLVARAQAEDVLASRALEGVEEAIYYHGEVVATRRRYDARLLLAHLARLDRLTANAPVNAFAEDFDAALDRFARGEAQPDPVAEIAPDPVQGAAPSTAPEPAAAQGDILTPGQCNTRSMSPPGRDGAEDLAAPEEGAESAPEPDPAPDPCPDCGGRCLGPRRLLTERDCMWLGNRLDRMDAARPRRAKLPHEIPAPGWDSGEVEWEQLKAFEAGVERWWLVIPSEEDAWCYVEESGAGVGVGA